MQISLKITNNKKSKNNTIAPKKRPISTTKRQQLLRRNNKKLSILQHSQFTSSMSSDNTIEPTTSITIPLLTLPRVNLDRTDLLDDKKSIYQRASEGNFEIADEVYTLEEIDEFEKQLELQHKGSILTGFYRNKIETGNHWNTFYKNNKNNFFKDRHYFHREIPQLMEKYSDYEEYIKVHQKFQQSDLNTIKRPTSSSTDALVAQSESNSPLPQNTSPVDNNETIILDQYGSITLTDPQNIAKFMAEFTPHERAILTQSTPRQPLTLAEVGCGVGNTFFPLLEDLPLLHIKGCDVSAAAIDIIKQSTEYSTKPYIFDVGVCDISKKILPFEDNSADIVTLIFTLSALSPEYFHHVLTECRRIMKPNAIFYMRDYAIWDLTMLRFKKGQRLSNEEPLFVRGDGTKTYFFERMKLINSMRNAGFVVNDEDVKYIKKTVENRKLELSMERRWIFASGTKDVNILPTHECECPEHLLKKNVQ